MPIILGSSSRLVAFDKLHRCRKWVESLDRGFPQTKIRMEFLERNRDMNYLDVVVTGCICIGLSEKFPPQGDMNIEE
ncbi:hypothetical protein [Veronia pacifica]|uniref:Uncharacterized protein n=1 Tax=Veronia pacifica TaxID=1080227 RepID=A0A1C3ERA9_9GAMM|nr:hypothetical protein [Veronia pacifica]ODA35779.1 hypothetical protein A8L45_01700 [Veronia pacifica]